MRLVCQRFNWIVLGLLGLGCVGCNQSPRGEQEAFELRGEPIKPQTAETTELTERAAPVDPVGSVESLQTAQAGASVDPVPTSAEQSEPAALEVVPTAPAPTQDNLAVADSSDTPAEPDENGFLRLGFDVLSGYVINIPDEMLSAPLASVTNSVQPADLIPDRVKKLNDRQVSLQGFMLPLKVEGGLVTELLLMKDQSMCCYGTVPKINEWVSVKMAKRGVKAVMDIPVTLHGTLHVGAMLDNGYLVGIYSMDGKTMTGPLDE